MTTRRKETCICGYETRSDYIHKHIKTCTAIPIIRKLKEENINLKTRIEIYDELPFSKRDDEVEYLRKQLEIKNQIIQQKDAEIKLLSSNQNVTNHFNVTNVLNIFPYGKEPILEKKDVLTLLAKPSESVPLYIKMKHFKDGLSNVRIKNNDIEVVEENENGELSWVVKDKNETLFAITDTNLEEFHDEYGSNDFMWKRWFITNGLNRDGYEHTRQFKDLLKKVESVFTTDV